MAEIINNIIQIEPDGLSGFSPLTDSDKAILRYTTVPRAFKPNDNFIELSYFTLDGIRVLTIPDYADYSILGGGTLNDSTGNTEISIDVEQDHSEYGFAGTELRALYNFLDYPYSSTTLPSPFYIESISPDRTELRLVSINLGKEEVNGELVDTVGEISTKLIERYTNETLLPEFFLYFGNNIFLNIVNIDVEEFRNTNAVLIKLYEPLLNAVKLKGRVNIVEKIAESVAYEIESELIPDEEVVPTLRGANFSIEVEEQSTEPSQYYNHTELFSFPTNNTYRELNSLFNEKGAEIGVDYSDFNFFINFSSAEERLRNFKYKLDLIESYQTNLDLVSSISYSGTGAEGSTQYYKDLLDGVVNNFDHYERHLYFTNGTTAWPKSNSSKPYINKLSSSTDAVTWYNSELQSAILYDAQNPDILINTVPSYLKEDTTNEPYELFIHMIGQHFDNLWVYTDAVSNKYNADNRINVGVSKDLVEDLLKNFGVKLYSSNKSTTELFKYFTSNSYEVGGEKIPAGIITSGEEPISQNDYQKEIYRRVYHNLPLLMKSKGTERGLRALINCFGIPSDVLKIRLYGGQSSNDLPFFGGQQELTGSIDKVRLDNTGSIAPGNTVSLLTPVITPNNEYTQDLHRIEVGFSPTHNIDTYIVSQSAFLFPNDPFNIDDYIGDPRGYPTNRYTELEEYSKTILENVDAYNVKDFVRLIKFFDNVIFRMVRDFTPARAVTDTGIIIKPHLLDRSKFKSPIVTWTRPEYSGSIDTAFIEGSHGTAYRSGSGEYSTAYSASVMTPFGEVVKKWTPYHGAPVYSRSAEEAKFDGELTGSLITVSTGELNSDNPFKELEYKNIRYNVAFYKEIPAGVCVITSNDIIASEASGLTDLLEYTVSVTQLFEDMTGNFSYTSLGEAEVTITGNSINMEFQDQYSSVEITATKDNDDTCTATSTITAVLCNAEIADGVPQIQLDTPIDLTSLFQPNDNTDFSILINNQVVENPQNHVFDEEIDAFITFRDNVDTTCEIVYQTEVDACTLTTPLLDNRDWTVFQINKYPNLYPNTVDNPNQVIWGGDEFFSFLEIFPGSNSATTFQIKFNGQWQGGGYTQWLNCPIHDLGTEGARFFPTNFKRLSEDYPSFNQSYTTNYNPQSNRYEPTLFGIYFRAIQTDDCVTGDDTGNPATTVQWYPHQDQVGESQQWQGPIAINAKYRVPASYKAGNNTIVDSDGDGIPDVSPDDMPLSDIDDNGNEFSGPHEVCNALIQDGTPEGGEEIFIYGRIDWYLPSESDWNQNQTRSSVYNQLTSEEPLFYDQRGFNPIINGVYTDYRARSSGQGQDQGEPESPFTEWAGYDYFFRPNQPGETTADPYVAAKRYRSVYERSETHQGRLFQCYSNP